MERKIYNYARMELEKLENKKNVLVGTLIMIIIICVCLTTYIVIDKTNTISNNNNDMIDKDDVGEKELDNNLENSNADEIVDKDSADEKSLDINSDLVKNLYSNVQSDGGHCFNTLKEQKEEELSVADITNETKFMMAINLLSSNDITTISCNDYEPTKFFDLNDLNSGYDLGCGKSLYNRVEDKFEMHDGSIPYTYLYKEDTIKIKWNQIFGPGSYIHLDYVSYAGSPLKYLAEEKGYAVLSVPLGGICDPGQTNLSSAIKKDNKIIITEEVLYEIEGSQTYSYVYTFTLNEDDNNYYFSNLKKTLKK